MWDRYLGPTHDETERFVAHFRLQLFLEPDLHHSAHIILLTQQRVVGGAGVLHCRLQQLHPSSQHPIPYITTCRSKKQRQEGNTMRASITTLGALWPKRDRMAFKYSLPLHERMNQKGARDY